MVTIKDILELLATYGGEVISSNDEKPEWIAQAREGGRMYVDENSLGYIWNPPAKFLPETDEEIELFEKWYPLPIEVPEEINTYEKMLFRFKQMQLERRQQKEN